VPWLISFSLGLRNRSHDSINSCPHRNRCRRRRHFILHGAAASFASFWPARSSLAREFNSISTLPRCRGPLLGTNLVLTPEVNGLRSIPHFIFFWVAFTSVLSESRRVRITHFSSAAPRRRSSADRAVISGERGSIFPLEDGDTAGQEIDRSRINPRRHTRRVGIEHDYVGEFPCEKIAVISAHGLTRHLVIP
jgi:hypothetical protein